MEAWELNLASTDRVTTGLVAVAVDQFNPDRRAMAVLVVAAVAEIQVEGRLVPAAGVL